MARPINEICSKCHINVKKITSRNAPECYVPERCQKKRHYYKYLKKNRKKQMEYHRYIKFKGDKCCLCRSTEKLEAHHIKRQVDGGVDSKNNIITLCYSCHIVAGNYDNAIAQIAGKKVRSPLE